MSTTQPESAPQEGKPRGGLRSRMLVSLAVLGVAGAVVGMVSLRAGADTTPAAQPAATQSTVDIAELAAQSPLALPLAEQLSQGTGSLAEAAAPVQAAVPAAATPAAAVAPAAAPATTASHADMAAAPAASASDSSCVPKDVLEPILAHIQSAHLETSVGQQVTDALNLDQYIKTHTVWLENVLAPVMNGSADKTVTDTLAPIWAHIQSAHLETSLGQQVQDLLNLDQYVKTHTVWLEQVLTPLMTQASC